MDNFNRNSERVSGRSLYWIYCKSCKIMLCYILAGLERHQRGDCCGCEQRLPLCWTEGAAPWISQQLGMLVLHIAGTVMVIALCWCWQCLLTVRGNLLPLISTPLDVTIVAWCCRQTQDVLHPAECPPAALQHIIVTVTSKCLHYLTLHRKLH